MGFFFRVHRLPEVPSGLTWDEGAEGLEAARLFHGQFALFFPEHGGHEPLLVYLQAASLKLFGWSAFSLRLPNVFLTTLALAASFLVARKLFGRHVAWLATLLQAVALWPLIMSRLAIRPAALILFGALAIYWLARWLRGQDARRSAALCGLFTAAASYTYTPGRFLVLVVGLAWLAALTAAPKRRPLLDQAALAGGIAAAGLAPLGWYFGRNPGTFSERAGELSIFNPAFGPPLLNWLNSLKATLLMFSFAGEPGWDKNIAHQPLFDPVLSVLLLAGVGLAVWHWRQPRYLLALAWLGIMLLPLTLTAKDLPDFGRVSGIAPAVFLFPALAAAAVWRRWLATGWLLAAGAVALAGVSYWQYFNVWERAEGKAESYRPAVLEAGHSAIGRLHARDAPALVYLGVPEAYDAVADFLVAGFNIEHPDDGWRLLAYDAQYTEVAPPPGAESYLMAAGGAPITALPAPRIPASLDLGDVLQVYGYDLPARISPGETLTLRAFWRPARSVSSVTFFAHLVDYSGNKTLAARDHDGFPPDQWRGGERVVSSFPLVAPAGTPAGAYWVEFGAYTAGGQHLLIDGNQERKLLGPVVISLEATAGGAAAVAELGSRIGLLPPSVTRAGDGLDIGLRWLPAQPLTRDYSVFVHVLDGSGQLVAQADGPPAGGRWPAPYWLPNLAVDDSRHVRLPPGLPAGQYRVSAGLYRLDTGERLATTPVGPEPGSVLIGEVTLG